jgi:diamine N-acetyltransferase
MFLRGKHIYLRALEPTDADTLYSWENDREVWPVSLTQLPFSRFILEEFVNAAYQDIYINRQLRLMICNADDDKAVGIADLFDFEPQHGRCGLGIFIHADHRQNGHGKESIRLVRDYAFGTLHLKQLFVHVNNANSASLALFEKAGFEKSGLKKCWNKTGLNDYEDVWFLQCLNPGA